MVGSLQKPLTLKLQKGTNYDDRSERTFNIKRDLAGYRP